ncbi:MAG TPA: TIGR03619 family F420-dependent LLM class oxidoreductase [Candidatus Binataceae bacterium]|jgi:probable F420-dependent oxidoreductase|nr:TIGR03619 family F420-dependent LLM class oxidoreductase [Candidatus Binataceae bacterium]
MKIGVGAFIDESTQAPDVIGRKCEELGFESIWLPEHPVMPVATRPPQSSVSDRVFENQQVPDWYTRIPDPFITLIAVAAATRRLKLGTGICLVPEHEPITLAKTIATLDLFSGGRFLFGIGAGGIREESAAMGVDFRRRWVITREYIAVMKELWTKTDSQFQGEFVKFPPLKSLPKPLQRPHPPIHIGAGGMGPKYTRALKDTVAIGDGWAPVAVPPHQLVKDLARSRSRAGRSRLQPARNLHLHAHRDGLAARYHPRLRRLRRASPGLHPVCAAAYRAGARGSG